MFLLNLGKTDMVKVDTSYLWQTPGGGNAQVLCALIPVSSTSTIHADMGIFTPMSAFSFTGNTALPQFSA